MPTGLWIDGKSRGAAGASSPSSIRRTGPFGVGRQCDARRRRAGDGLRTSSGGEWAATPPRQRSEILRRAFELLTERADDFALVMTLEMGRSWPRPVGKWAYGAEFLRWFAEEAVRIGGRTTTAPAGTGEIIVTKEPVGMCLAVTPWNFRWRWALQDQARPGGWLHDDRQTVRGHSADDAAAGAGLRRRGAAAGCAVGAADDRLEGHRRRDHG